MITGDDKKNFSRLAESLKLSRRADLDAFCDDDAIESLYVDPFKNDLIINSMLSANSTLLIGRKGTGKSTIILKLQHELKKNNSVLSIYLDVKTIFEQTKSLNFEDEKYSGIIDVENTKRYLLYKAFLKQVLEEIKNELKKKVSAKNAIFKIFDKVTKKVTFEDEINNLLSHINESKYNDITLLKKVGQKNVSKNADNKEHLDSIKAEASISNIFVAATTSKKNSVAEENTIESEFSQILMKYYNTKEIMHKIKNILLKLQIKHLYICLDDFSEIDKGAIDIFVDSIIAPLNNWSEEFIKFKICVYPNRYYLGDIDSTKIDILNLDYFDMYSSTNSANSFLEAIDYTKRLLDVRFKYFCKKDITEFIDEKVQIDDFYKEIFYITANVPRSIGRILWYVNRYTISQDKKITIKDLKSASEQFYSEAIAEFFNKTMHVKLSYDEKLNKKHLQSILELIIKKAKQNKTEIGKSDAQIFSKYNTNTAPTSFFYTFKDPSFEQVLSSLELNYFITKYNEQKDKDGKVVNIYWINHGLCQKEDIIFGKGDDRKYIIERRFNYGPAIKEYIEGLQEIECSSCGERFDLTELPMLKKYGMKCYKCGAGKCHVRTIKIDLPELENTVQLPEIEYDILRTISIAQKELYASQIAEELDCSYQLVSKRAKKLKDLSYLKHSKERREYGTRTYYSLTDEALRDFDLK